MSAVSSAQIPIAPAPEASSRTGHPPSAATSGIAAATSTKAKSLATPEPVLWEKSSKDVRDWAEKTLLPITITQQAVGDGNAESSSTTSPSAEMSGALENLFTAIAAVELRSVPDDETMERDDGADDEDAVGSSPPRKKRRTAKVLVDPYRVWIHIKRNEEDTDDSGLQVAATVGGKLMALSVGGILNGMALVEGGVTVHLTPSTETLKTSGAPPTVVPLLAAARTWHAAVQNQVQRDTIAATPRRIREHLCPKISDKDFANIRKRVYKTAVQGEGLHTDEVTDPDVVTGVPTMSHDIEKSKKCPNCGNAEQEKFVTDRKNGDIICNNCGFVVSESLMHEGQAYRKFEGEVDRNHHGDAPNPLFSNAYNLSTSLSGVAPTTGAGIGGWRSGGGRGGSPETLLKNAHSFTEYMLSRVGKDDGDRSTTTHTKDKQKRKAFDKMRSTADALDLHEAVVERARVLFSAMRDDRQLLQDFEGVIACSLILAFEELAEADRQKKKTAENGPDAPGETSDAASATTFQLSKRAARRNELHHANLAGKGGLLLDFSSVGTKTGGQVLSHAASSSSIGASSSNNSPSGGNRNGETTKPVEHWDMEDCRRWLSNKAVPQIAHEWVEARETKKDEGIPSGTRDELEGELTMKVFVLTEYMDKELKSKQEPKRKKVVTPRLNDLGKLGIQFQNKRERGAGFKTLPQANKPKRTAGKLFMGKTEAELAAIIEDKLAGKAIHKKLREVLSQQRERERQAQRDEASRKRLLQSQRKAYLLGRLQS